MVVAVPPSIATLARPAAGPVAMTTAIWLVPATGLYVADAVEALAYFVAPPELVPALAVVQVPANVTRLVTVSWSSPSVMAVEAVDAVLRLPAAS